MGPKDQRPEVGSRTPLSRSYANSAIRSFRDLRVYQTAFVLAGELFKLTKQWPAEEKFALTSQIRRSSRAIGANISEAWGKRMYPAHFLSKLTDADGELQETIHWLDCAFMHCEYIRANVHSKISADLAYIGQMLGKMIEHPEGFLLSPPVVTQTRKVSRVSHISPASDFRPPAPDFRPPASR